MFQIGLHLFIIVACDILKSQALLSALKIQALSLNTISISGLSIEFDTFSAGGTPAFLYFKMFFSSKIKDQVYRGDNSERKK